VLSMLRLLPLLAVFAAPRAAAQPSTREAADSLLLTTGELRDRLTRGNVVLLHIGEPADYQAGHIPGARFLPYDAISQRRNGLVLELPPVLALHSLFESLGVSDESRIVLYWSKDWYSPTTRVFLTLDYLGLGERTSILDGGFAAWKAAGGPVTTAVPSHAHGTLTIHPRSDVIVDATAVRSAIGDARAVIIDARDPRFYTGQATGMHVREGHVPGAKNLPFTTLIDERGTFKPRETLEKLMDAAGATPDKRVISYCHIGQQATVVYFAARLLGRDARLYDGSWDEWSRLSELPIETGRR
jgi:thiosulfate/3-mercaptopyruvate sulfurtransferase